MLTSLYLLVAILTIALATGILYITSVKVGKRIELKFLITYAVFAFLTVMGIFYLQDLAIFKSSIAYFFTVVSAAAISALIVTLLQKKSALKTPELTLSAAEIELPKRKTDFHKEEVPPEGNSRRKVLKKAGVGYQEIDLEEQDYEKIVDRMIDKKETNRIINDQPKTKGVRMEENQETDNFIGFVRETAPVLEEGLLETKENPPTIPELKEEFIEEHINLGFDYKERSLLVEAISEFKKVISAKPDDEIALLLYMEMGTIYQRLQDYDKAVTELTEALILSNYLGKSEVERELFATINNLHEMLGKNQ